VIKLCIKPSNRRIERVTETVFRLRAERVRRLNSTGHLPWIRSSGGKSAAVGTRRARLLTQRTRWDDVTTPLDPELFRIVLTWAWTLPDSRWRLVRGFRFRQTGTWRLHLKSSSRSPGVGVWTPIFRDWLGCWFAIDDLLGIHGDGILDSRFRLSLSKAWHC